MNSRFIDIVALLDDAVLNENPIIIDSCRYYPTWNKEDEMYRLMDCFGGSFSLEQNQIDEWKWEGHEIEYDA